jgi:hypothetical protein
MTSPPPQADPYGDHGHHLDPPPDSAYSIVPSAAQVLAAPLIELQDLTGANMNQLPAVIAAGSLDLLDNTVAELSGIESRFQSHDLPNAGYSDLMDIDSLTGLPSHSGSDLIESSPLVNNTSPLLGDAFQSDPFLSQIDEDQIASLSSLETYVPEFSTSKPAINNTSSPHVFILDEDEKFSIDLQQLFPDADLITAVDVQSADSYGANWLHYAENYLPDHTLLERVIIEVRLRDILGQPLTQQDLALLPQGSHVQADLLVSDNRSNGNGLLGLNLDLAWNPDALTLQSTVLASDYPLFREEGELDATSGILKGLQAGSLPISGSGSILGDQHQDIFASLDFTVGDTAQNDVNISIHPHKISTVKNQPLSPTQVLAVGTHIPLISVLEGTATQALVGTRELSVHAVDANGRQWQQPLILKVNNINDAPQTRGIPTIYTLEERPLAIHLAEYFEDEDPDDRMTYHWISTPPSWLTLDSATGIITGLPDDPELGTWKLTVEARDSSNLSIQQTFDLTIDNTNDKPIWAGYNIPPIPIRAEREFSINLPSRLFVDNDTNDNLSFSLVQLPDLQQPNWLHIDSHSGRISGTAPAKGQPPLQFRISATDNSGETTSTLLNLEVVDELSNHFPYVSGQPLKDLSTLEGDLLRFNIQDLFQDDDTLIGDRLRFEVEAPSWLHFDPESGLLSGIPDNDAVGQSRVTVRAVDLDGASVENSFNLTVENVNQAPERNTPSSANLLLRTNSVYELDLDDIFADTDTIHGDWINYGVRLMNMSYPGQPNWLDWNGRDGTLRLSPGDSDRGLLSILFTATDRAGAHSDFHLDIKVVSADGLIEVDQAIPQIDIQPGEEKRYAVSSAFSQSYAADTATYSTQLLRREQDGSFTPVSEADSDWIQLVPRRTDLEAQLNKITIAPALYRLDNGEPIHPEEIHTLQPGTPIQLAVKVSDLRASSQHRGIVGLDLKLEWSGLSLDPALETLPTTAINPLFPLFRNAELLGPQKQILHVSAASLPAMGLGQALGDRPEDFLTLPLRVSDTNQPIHIELTLNDEANGGLGVGLADGTNVLDQLLLLSWSPPNQVDMLLDPNINDQGHFAIRLNASIGGRDLVSQTIPVSVGMQGNESPFTNETTTNLSVKDNLIDVLPLNRVFSDPEGAPLTYSLWLNGATRADEEVMRNSVYLVKHQGQDRLVVNTPGLTKPVYGDLILTADDGRAQTQKFLKVQLDPRSQPVSLIPIQNLGAANTDQYLSLSELLGVDKIAVIDQSDDSFLRLRSSQPLNIRFSDNAIAAAGLTLDSIAQFQRSWLKSVGDNVFSLQIPTQGLVSRRDGSNQNLGLDWLEILSPNQPSQMMAVEFSTLSTVAGDSNGDVYGISESIWYSSLLRTRSARLNSKPLNNAATERYLENLMTSSEIGSSLLSAQFTHSADRQDLTLFAWRTQADFIAATMHDLPDKKSIVSMQLNSKNQNNSEDPLIRNGFVDVSVLGINDPYFEGQIPGSENVTGYTIQTPFDPLYFSIAPTGTRRSLIDVDMDRAGTQVVVDIDLSMSALKSGELNSFRKFVSTSTIHDATAQGFVLSDLNKNPITKAGWYDFSQRYNLDGRPVGDGAEYIIQTIDGIDCIKGIRIRLTDNSFGDDNLALGIIDDPLLPVKILDIAMSPPSSDSVSASSLAQGTNSFTNLVISSSSSQVSGADLDIRSLDPRISSMSGSHPSNPYRQGLNATNLSVDQMSIINPDLFALSQFTDSQLEPHSSISEPSPAIYSHAQESTPMTTNANLRNPAIPNGSADPSHTNLAPQTGLNSQMPPMYPHTLHKLLDTDTSAVGFFQNEAFDVTDSKNVMASLLLGMLVFPSTAERGIRSLLLDSKIGETIRLQRRSCDLQARWSLHFVSNTQSFVHLFLELRNGRLHLCQQPTQSLNESSISLQSIPDLRGLVLWDVLNASERPGDLFRQIEQRLGSLLDPLQQSSDQAWTCWINQIDQVTDWNLVLGGRRGLNGLRQSLHQLEAIDPSLADAMMVVELLHCHIRLGGQLPWLFGKHSGNDPH